MQDAIQSTTIRRRPPQVPFALPADDRLTSEHRLINAYAIFNELFFVFGRDDTSKEFVISCKPKNNFSDLMDAVKDERLTVGNKTVSFRGAVKEKFYSAVVAAHFRSL